MKGFFLIWDVSHLTLQWHVGIALYVLFRWCHGGIVFCVSVSLLI